MTTTFGCSSLGAPKACKLVVLNEETAKKKETPLGGATAGD